MPYFQITKTADQVRLGTVEADDAKEALDVMAMKFGFWDFQDLAVSMNVSVDKAARALSIRDATGPTYDGDDPAPVREPVYL